MFSELNNWFKPRPAWLQETASALLHKGSLADDDVEAFFGKCLQEVQSLGAQAVASCPAELGMARLKKQFLLDAA